MTGMYDKNLALFRELGPDLHRVLASRGKSQKNLIQVGDDDWDVEIDGKRFYGMGARDHANRQVKEFWEKQVNRLTLTPPQFQDFEPRTQNFFKSMLKRAVDNDITLYENRCDLRGRHLIVMGVGLAEHLPLIVNLMECSHVILLETDLRLIQASLHTFDWISFIDEYIDKRKCEFSLVFGENGRQAYDVIKTSIRQHREASFIDGFCLFEHFHTETFGYVGQKFFSQKDFLVRIGGWTFDEMNMIHNAFFNLRDHRPKILRCSSRPLKIPVFVVGAGPSLDADIPVIRENADRAIIISGGSSIAPLMDAGIVPDFHTEGENVIENYEMLYALPKRHDISKIPLVGSTTIHPNTLDLFETSIVFFREDLASYPLFSTGTDSSLSMCTPTAANLIVDFCAGVGASEIYMFGVDMGSHDVNKHHAADTAYNRGEMGFEWHFDLNVEVPANFGGTSLTHKSYLEAKAIIEVLIHYSNEGTKWYNCSDGALIDGAQPMRSETINLTSTAEAKSNTMTRMLNSFPRFTDENFQSAWNGETRLSANKQLRDAMVQEITDAGDGYNEVLNGIFGVVAHLLPHGQVAPEHVQVARPEMHLYRGSILQALVAAYFFLCRVGNDADRGKFSAIVKDEIITLIDEFHTYIEEFYAGLADPNTAVEMTVFDER